MTPTWPQWGQAIRVNMSGSLARSAAWLALDDRRMIR